MNSALSKANCCKSDSKISSRAINAASASTRACAHWLYLHHSPCLAIMAEITATQHRPSMQRIIGSGGRRNLMPSSTNKISGKFQQVRNGRVRESLQEHSYFPDLGEMGKMAGALALNKW
jgi:hypothetical protein